MLHFYYVITVEFRPFILLRNFMWLESNFSTGLYQISGLEAGSQINLPVISASTPGLQQNTSSSEHRW